MPTRDTPVPSITASTPAQVFGFPQPSDRFRSRYRNEAPLVIRQIIDPRVIEQWTVDQAHVVQSLNQSVLERLPTMVAAAGEFKDEDRQEDGPQLEVMVASDKTNFMDNPQFTTKVLMTAQAIVHRVMSVDQTNEAAQTRADGLADGKGGKEDEDGRDSKDTLDTLNTTTTPSACPLCDTNTRNNLLKDTLTHPRFYYRGMVPHSLYSDLCIPNLLKALDLPLATSAFASAPNRDLMRIWMSLAGATTPLHYDRCHGILIQLVGRKRFIVFPHEDTKGLYPYDGISGPRHASKVRGLAHCFPFIARSTLPPLSSLASTVSSPTSPVPSAIYPNEVSGQGQQDHLEQQQQQQQHHQDSMAEVLERWPKVKTTAPWVIDLEPGDALYTPPGFWHEVTSVDNSISITVPWDMDADEIDSMPAHMAF